MHIISKEFAGKKNDESSHDWFSEGDLESLVGLQRILCDAVGKMHSEWHQLRYVFTYILVHDYTMEPFVNSI